MIRITTLILILILKTTVAQKITISFRIDDYGIDNLGLYKKLIPIFSLNNIPLTIGIVPYTQKNNFIIPSLSNDKKTFLDSLKQNKLIDFALHGYIHKNRLTNTKEASEFYNLGQQQQYLIIKKGKLEIENQLEKKIDLFIPPWNTYDSNTIDALLKNDFKFISAARYGLIERNTKSIKSLPYTCLINQLKTAVKQAQEDRNQKEKNLVVLIHAYDFEDKRNTKSSSQINEKTLNDFNKTLIDLKQNKNISFIKLKEIKISFSNQESMYFPNYMFPVYSFLKYKEPLYLKELNIWEKASFKLVSICLITVVLAMALLINFVLNKQIHKNKKSIFSYFIILLLIFYLFMLVDTISSLYIRVLLLVLILLSLKNIILKKDGKTKRI